MHFFYYFLDIFCRIHSAIKDHNNIFGGNFYILKTFADAVDNA